MSETPTYRAVLSDLESRGLADPEATASVEEWLIEREYRSSDPLYIRVLAGAGAWGSVAFFLAFLELAHLFPHTGAGMIVFGVILLAAAVVLRRIGGKTFVSQLALALAIAGNSLAVIGLTEGVGYRMELLYIGLAQAFITALVYPFFRDVIYRFLAPVTAIALLFVWIVDYESLALVHVTIAALGVAFYFLFFEFERTRALMPLKYAVAVSLLGASAFLTAIGCSPYEEFNLSLWPSRVFLTLGVAAVFVRLGGLNRIRSERMITALAAAILFGAVSNPGLILAVGLLAMGYARDDRGLISLAIAFLPPFLFLYYYDLNIDLAYKSWALLLGGTILLGARWVLGTRPWAKEV